MKEFVPPLPSSRKVGEKASSDNNNNKVGKEHVSDDGHVDAPPVVLEGDLVGLLCKVSSPDLTGLGGEVSGGKGKRSYGSTGGARGKWTGSPKNFRRPRVMRIAAHHFAPAFLMRLCNN